MNRTVRQKQRTRLARLARVGICLIVAMSASACGKGKATSVADQVPVFPVEGMATLNGQPMADAFIQLHPVQRSATGDMLKPRAHVDSDGKFHITTYTAQDGAPAGEYLATISWKGSLEGVSDAQEDRLVERLPRQFLQPGTSGLKVLVREGENALPPWDLEISQMQVAK